MAMAWVTFAIHALQNSARSVTAAASMRARVALMKSGALRWELDEVAAVAEPMVDLRSRCFGSCSSRLYGIGDPVVSCTRGLGPALNPENTPAVHDRWSESAQQDFCSRERHRFHRASFGVCGSHVEDLDDVRRS